MRLENVTYPLYLSSLSGAHFISLYTTRVETFKTTVLCYEHIKKYWFVQSLDSFCVIDIHVVYSVAYPESDHKGAWTLSTGAGRRGGGENN